MLAEGGRRGSATLGGPEPAERPGLPV